MKRLFTQIIFLLFSGILTAQTNAIFSLYLIGDAGKDTVPGKALLLLKDELNLHPNSAVVFLGDNVYPSGLKENDRPSRMRLESQLQILNEYAGKVFFIPGNHDWQAQRWKGLEILKNQEVFVEDYFKNKTTIEPKNARVFLPENGLPGPETIMLADKLRLIIIDTQWFLHFYKKNKIQTKKHTKQLFYSRLDSLLSIAKQNKEQVIIAGHHPLFTNGKHSRGAQPIRFLINYTPFGIFGLMGLNRFFSQDLAQPSYKKMRNRLLKSINQYDNITYASGHDHNLQFFKHCANRYIVSGSGSKSEHLKKRKKFDAVFQDDTKTGFVKLEYDADGSRKTIIYRVGEQEKSQEGF